MPHVPELARTLGLSPHPAGGWYRRIYTSPVPVRHPAGGGSRASATMIHYLLAPGGRNEWHNVASDEVWFWQHGGPLRLHTSPPGPAPTTVTEHLLTPDPPTGADPCFHLAVPAGSWQRAEPAADRDVLVSCVVTPGFDFADFALLSRS
ncbi:cupin domain-containing protein [Actinacidiphila sp. bgisy145]|uniref:cupin domain-containing protein n=1 Tax=Actinacidiphila sp. bgisy145 TaxID=3413792 RepID=UPI003EB6E871